MQGVIDTIGKWWLRWNYAGETEVSKEIKIRKQIYFCRSSKNVFANFFLSHLRFLTLSRLVGGKTETTTKKTFPAKHFKSFSLLLQRRLVRSCRSLMLFTHWRTFAQLSYRGELICAIARLLAQVTHQSIAGVLSAIESNNLRATQLIIKVDVLYFMSASFAFLYNLA